MSNRKFIPLACAIAALVSGCSSSEIFNKSVSERIAEKIPQQPVALKAEAPIFVDVAKEDVKNIDLLLNNAPFLPVMEKLVREMGWSLKLIDVDRNAKVLISTYNMSLKEAIKELALSAGYVAVFKEAEKKIYLSSVATYNFRVAPYLLSTTAVESKVGGNPSQLNSGGGGGQSNQQSPKGTDTLFTETIRTTGPGTQFISMLQEIAGEGATVRVVADTGDISVRAGANALQRVHEFINEQAISALTMIEIETALIEVSLTGNFAYGIRWDQIMGQVTTGFDSSSTGPVAGAVANYTGSGISGIISALQKNSASEVVARPYLSSFNNRVATSTDVIQQPYIQSVSPASTGGMYGMSASSQVSFAQDGLNFTVLSRVMPNSDIVFFDVLPVMTSILGMNNLDAGNGATARVPTQKLRNTSIHASARNGQTIAISGSRYSSRQVDKQGIPGVVDSPILGDVLSGRGESSQDRELVILLTPKIIRVPKDYDALIGQSI